jgi:hypothetical protein
MIYQAQPRAFSLPPAYQPAGRPPCRRVSGIAHLAGANVPRKLEPRRIHELAAHGAGLSTNATSLRESVRMTPIVGVRSRACKKPRPDGHHHIPRLFFCGAGPGGPEAPLAATSSFFSSAVACFPPVPLVCAP